MGGAAAGPPHQAGRKTAASLIETGTGFKPVWLMYMLMTYGSATLLLHQLVNSPYFNPTWRQQVPSQFHYYTTLVFGTAFLLDLLAAMFYHDSSRLEITLLPAWIKGMPFLSSLLMATGNAVLAEQAGTGKIVNLQRYICWMHTCPAMLYLIKSVSPTIGTRHVLGIILLHEVQLGLGAVAKLAGGMTEMVLGFFVHLALVPVVVFLHHGLKELASNYSKWIARMVYGGTILTYVSFGVVWDLDMLGLIDPRNEEATYLIAEFLSKILFSSVLMLSSFATADLRRLMVMRSIESASKQKLISELRKAVDQKDQFMSSVSHELRTPLNGIIGMSEAAIYNSDVAKERLDSGKVAAPSTSSQQQQQQQQQLYQQQVLLEAPTRKQFELIRSSGLRLLSLVNDILDATALQHDRLQLSRHRVVLKPLVDEVADITRPLLQSGVELLTQVPLDLQVIGDQDRIVQVLNNLVSNAVKFTERGTITISAYTGLQEDRTQRQQGSSGGGGGSSSSINGSNRQQHQAPDLRQAPAMREVVFVSVIDTGYGIPSNKLKEIFLPFEQVHTALSRSHRGLGLGLSITHKLIDAMGGSIEARSSEGKGSTFTFSLLAYSPAAMALVGGPASANRRRRQQQQQMAAAAAAASTSGSGSGSGGNKKQHKVLSAARNKAAGSSSSGARRAWEYAEHVEERRQQQEDWGAAAAGGSSSSSSEEESGADEPNTPDTFAMGTNTTTSDGSIDEASVAGLGAEQDAAAAPPVPAAPAGAAAAAPAASHRIMSPRQAVMALGSAGLWGKAGAPTTSESAAAAVAAAELATAAAPRAGGSSDQEVVPSKQALPQDDEDDGGSSSTSSGEIVMAGSAAAAAAAGGFWQGQDRQQLQACGIAVSDATPAAAVMNPAGSRLQFYSAVNGGRRQLLAVDDDEVSHQVLTLLLESAGYVLQHAKSGAAALSYLSSSSSSAGVIPDMVLLDMAMPGMDGMEVCRRVRSMLAGSGVHLPISIVTAQDSPTASAAAVVAGADDVLTKPFTRHQLLSCVSRNLAKQQHPGGGQ